MASPKYKIEWGALELTCTGLNFVQPLKSWLFGLLVSEDIQPSEAKVIFTVADEYINNLGFTEITMFTKDGTRFAITVEQPPDP